jgi:lipid A ethanolaminephosphotransferase
VAHDHLFHTVLGLLDVQTALREEALNLTQGCAVAAGAGAGAVSGSGSGSMLAR